MHASDYIPKQAVPRLKSKLSKEDENIKTVAAVDEVITLEETEDMDVVGEREGSLRRMLEGKCGAETVVVDGTGKYIISKNEG